VATIFLAHAAADRDRALALAAGLRSAGRTVFPEPPPVGDDGWWAGILAAVQDADIFLYATGQASVVVTALRDYAQAIGTPTLEVHLSGAGEATGVDFRRPTADAAFLLIGAMEALPPKPPVVRWQAAPESPFARVADLARDVRATTLTPGDQRALLDRLRFAPGDPAVRELAAALRLRPDLDAECARHLDEAFPGSKSGAFPGSGSGAFPGSGGGAFPGSNEEGSRPAGEQFRAPAGGLTPEDIRSIHFRKAPFGRRGYDEKSVDLFLDQVESDLRARRAGNPVVRVALTAVDVHEAAFKRQARGKRGYDEEEVDAFLDEIQRTIERLDQALAANGTTVTKG
jgi:DivIVA domain-containing protein